MLDRSLQAKLSRYAWKVLNLYLTQAVACDDAKAGGAVAVQSLGDFQNFHSNWARLIQKIYHVNPLLCPKCLGSMKIISFIDQDALIERILRHLGLWETRNHDPPSKSATHIPELTYDDSYSQLPPIDYWLQ